MWKLNTFGFALFPQLANRDTENVAICPLSVAYTAPMFLAGAAEGFVAEKELVTLLVDQDISHSLR